MFSDFDMPAILKAARGGDMKRVKKCVERGDDIDIQSDVNHTHIHTHTYIHTRMNIHTYTHIHTHT